MEKVHEKNRECNGNFKKVPERAIQITRIVLVNDCESNRQVLRRYLKRTKNTVWANLDHPE